MAKKILAGTHDTHNQNLSNEALLYQDTVLLTELLQLSYEYYQDDSVLYQESFIIFLRNFVEPIEAICKQNPTFPADYDMACIEFHRYMHEDFWRQAPTLEPLFNATARLVQYGVASFRLFDYPDPYRTVVEQLETIFNNSRIIQSDKQRIAALLIAQLRQKPL